MRLRLMGKLEFNGRMRCIVYKTLSSIVYPKVSIEKTPGVLSSEVNVVDPVNEPKTMHMTPHNPPDETFGEWMMIEPKTMHMTLHNPPDETFGEWMMVGHRLCRWNGPDK